MDTLFLTAEERKVFEGLSSDIKEGWNVKEESSVPEDSSERIGIRLQLLHLRDVKLQAFQKKAHILSSAEDLSSLIESTDLSGVAEADLAELAFALGATNVSVLLGSMLREVKSDDDLIGISALAVIRHSLLAVAV